MCAEAPFPLNPNNTQDLAATTYALQCVDPDQCGIGGGITLTEGPSTAAYTMAEGAAL
jgi:gamma-glutamyltranspeptidase